MLKKLTFCQLFLNLFQLIVSMDSSSFWKAEKNEDEFQWKVGYHSPRISQTIVVCFMLKKVNLNLYLGWVILSLPFVFIFLILNQNFRILLKITSFIISIWIWNKKNFSVYNWINQSIYINIPQGSKNYYVNFAFFLLIESRYKNAHVKAI